MYPIRVVQAECTIETNVEDWEVSAGEWLTAIRNGDKINFSFTTNTSADERVYYVKVLAYGVEKIITFTQQGDEIVNIPDAVFKEYLLGETTINTNADNEIRLSEAEAFTGTIELFLLSISDLTGLEAFINITKFICTEIEARTYDLSANTKLTEIRIHEGSIDEIDISSCIELEVLRCWDTFMTEIDISNNIKLTSINFGSNSLVQLDLTSKTQSWKK